jgi:hypothetical protein
MTTHHRSTSMPLLLLCILALMIAACADTASTGATSSEEPIPVEPDGGIGDGAAASGPSEPAIPVEGDGDIGDGTTGSDLAEPPDFGVSSETDSGAIAPYSSCWSAEGQGLCADGVPQPDRLSITADSQVVVTYAEGQLTAAWSTPPADGELGAADRTDLPVQQENPGIWLVDVTDVPTGDHVMWLFWTGEQGDASAAVSLVVQR